MAKITYTCTCPDYQQKHPGKLITRGISSAESREWNDIKEETIDCKHIVAMKLINKEFDFDDFPTDVPLDKLLPRQQQPKANWNTQSSKKSSHYG